MGILRDAIGSAMGSGKVNNGFGGPFGNRDNRQNGRESGYPSQTGKGYSSSPSPIQRYQGNDSYADDRNHYSPSQVQVGMGQSPGPRNASYDYDMQSSRHDFQAIGTGAYPDRGYQSIDRPAPYQIQQRDNNSPDQYLQPPPYEYSAPRRRDRDQGQSYDGRSYDDMRDGFSSAQRQSCDRRSYNDQSDGQSWDQGQSDEGRSYNDLSNTRDMRSSRNGGFRPLVLPQIAYGDGQPFLRGYSNELLQYGISQEEFIRVLDTINVAIIPSPENQIFQKGANIAGFFVPGPAGIGLMVGQLGVGIGSAVGHASLLSKALSEANLRLFVPKGLEICIAKTANIDAEVGIASASRRSDSMYGLLPEQRQAHYGNLVTPLSRVLPPLQHSGRSDPIAMLGRGIASRDSKKKQRKADEEFAEGETKKSDSLEQGYQWLMIRQASPDAMSYWENTLQQTNAAMVNDSARR